LAKISVFCIMYTPPTRMRKIIEAMCTRKIPSATTALSVMPITERTQKKPKSAMVAQ